MYYYSDGTEKPVGPVDDAALRMLLSAGTIQTHTPVMSEGASQWSTYAALMTAPATPTTHPPMPATPPAPPAPGMMGALGTRGRILQYNPNEGKGIVTVNGAQIPFEIGQWRGAEAPQVNRTVDVVLVNGAASTIAPVPESVLMAEKTNELKSKLGGLLGSADITSGQSVIDALGKPLLVGYGIFILASLILPVAKVEFMGFGQSATLWKATGLSDMMGSNHRFLLWASFLSILVPVFWKNPKAWLATLIPVLSLAWMGWSVYSQFHGSTSANDSMMGGMLSGMTGRKQESPFSLGFGAYVCMAASLYIAYVGVRKYLVRT
jgi:hypothetical protein